MIQLIAVGIVTAVAALLIKATKPDLAFAIVICGSIILLLFAIDLTGEVLTIFKDITELTGIDPTLVKLVLKMIGIGYLTEFSAGLISDFGLPSLADKIVLCGKLFILLLSVPILKSLLGLIRSLLALL